MKVLVVVAALALVSTPATAQSTSFTFQPEKHPFVEGKLREKPAVDYRVLSYEEERKFNRRKWPQQDQTIELKWSLNEFVTIQELKYDKPLIKRRGMPGRDDTFGIKITVPLQRY